MTSSHWHLTRNLLAIAVASLLIVAAVLLVSRPDNSRPSTPEYGPVPSTYHVCGQSFDMPSNVPTAILTKKTPRPAPAASSLPKQSSHVVKADTDVMLFVGSCSTGAKVVVRPTDATLLNTIIRAKDGDVHFIALTRAKRQPVTIRAWSADGSYLGEVTE